jgi:hypothetical protein
MSQNKFLYAVKFIACLMVITIHVRFPDPVGLYVTALARFAVPFFFAVSGRFLLADAGSTVEIRDRVLRSLKKLLKITALVYLIYQLYSVIYHIGIGVSLSDVISDRFNIGSFKRFLLFNSGKIIYDDSYAFDHMWYLFAMIYVLIFIFAFAPVLRKGYRAVMIILMLCLHFFTFMQGIREIRILGISFTTWYVTRSWLFTGIPYVLLGILWGDIVGRIRADRIPEEYGRIAALWKIPGICFLTTGILSTCVEAYLMGGKDIYMGSLLMVLGILLLSEAYAEKGTVIWKIGKSASSNIYFYHVLILAVLNLAADMGFIHTIPAGIRPFVIMVISILLFYILPELYRSVINVKKG